MPARAPSGSGAPRLRAPLPLPRSDGGRNAMSHISDAPSAPHMHARPHSRGVAIRSLVIGLTAFLTVVDLFATQAILPSLAQAYHVTPAAMGFAVNASTMGMALGALLVGAASDKLDRRT